MDSEAHHQCPYGQIGKVVSLKRRSSLCSNQSRGTIYKSFSCYTHSMTANNYTRKFINDAMYAPMLEKGEHASKEELIKSHMRIVVGIA